MRFLLWNYWTWMIICKSYWAHWRRTLPHQSFSNQHYKVINLKDRQSEFRFQIYTKRISRNEYYYPAYSCLFKSFSILWSVNTSMSQVVLEGWLTKQGHKNKVYCRELLLVLCFPLRIGKGDTLNSRIVCCLIMRAKQRQNQRGMYPTTLFSHLFSFWSLTLKLSQFHTPSSTARTALLFRQDLSIYSFKYSFYGCVEVHSLFLVFFLYRGIPVDQQVDVRLKQHKDHQMRHIREAQQR